MLRKIEVGMYMANCYILACDETREGLVIDYGRDGHIVSVEVLDASEHVTEPASIAFELKEAAAR